MSFGDTWLIYGQARSMLIIVSPGTERQRAVPRCAKRDGMPRVRTSRLQFYITLLLLKVHALASSQPRLPLRARRQRRLRELPPHVPRIECRSTLSFLQKKRWRARVDCDRTAALGYTAWHRRSSTALHASGMALDCSRSHTTGRATVRRRPRKPRRLQRLPH